MAVDAMAPFVNKSSATMSLTMHDKKGHPWGGIWTTDALSVFRNYMIKNMREVWYNRDCTMHLYLLGHSDLLNDMYHTVEKGTYFTLTELNPHFCSLYFMNDHNNSFRPIFISACPWLVKKVVCMWWQSIIIQILAQWILLTDVYLSYLQNKQASGICHLLVILKNTLLSK